MDAQLKAWRVDSTLLSFSFLANQGTMKANE
jgi:hypothetical protein